MRIEITLNGVTIPKEIPTSWDKVNFKTFVELSEAGNDTVKVLSLFTGVDEHTLRKAKITNLESVVAAIGFIFTQPQQVVPESILGYAIPKDLGFESIGQYEDLKEDTKKLVNQKPTGRQILEKYPFYCAIYAQPKLHGEYDWKKAEQLAPEFFNAPCSEVLAVGNFTYAKLIALIYHIDPKAQKALTLTRKLKLVLRSWLTRTAFTVRYFIWKRKLRSTAKSF